MAQKFLYVVAALVALAVAGWLVVGAFWVELVQWTLVPTENFADQEAPMAADYGDKSSWHIYPEDGDLAGADAVVFYIHPTAFFDTKAWNAPFGEEATEGLFDGFFDALQIKPFEAFRVAAPKYRQATLGAEITLSASASEALALAQGDILNAFDAFTAALAPDTPIILVAQGQGARHALHLLARRFNSDAMRDRLVGAWLTGQLLSLERDIATLAPVTACASPTEVGCINSWTSYLEAGDPAWEFDLYARSTGLDGQPRGTSPALCTNPLAWALTREAMPPSANPGTLVLPDGVDVRAILNNRMPEPILVSGRVGARCDKQGILWIPATGIPQIEEISDLEGRVGYFDFALFHKSIEINVRTRYAAYKARQAR